MQNSTFLIIGGLTIGLKKNGNKTKAPSKRVVHSWENHRKSLLYPMASFVYHLSGQKFTKMPKLKKLYATLGVIFQHCVMLPAPSRLQSGTARWRKLL